MNVQKRGLKISTPLSKHGQRKEGQMKMSFGMIFSIILMAIFIGFAFYAIQKFLDLQNSVQIAKFARDLQDDVDKLWKGSQGTQQQEYFLPSKIKEVCIIDFNPDLDQIQEPYDDLREFYYENENLFFHPAGSADGLNSKFLKHLDSEITLNQNPYCFENVKGKVKIVIKKEFGEPEVTLEK